MQSCLTFSSKQTAVQIAGWKHKKSASELAQSLFSTAFANAETLSGFVYMSAIIAAGNEMSLSFALSAS